jgi:RNA polymerase sigma-70 factor (ECF subfamily)
MANPEEDAAGSKASQPTDQSLLRRFRHGSEDAATQLYLRYAHRLRALAQAKCSPDLARRFDADDIVQSVFGSFFRGASKGLYDVPAGEELWKLFLVIALNKIRAKGAYHRAAKRDVRQTAGLEELEALPEPNVEQNEESFILLQAVVNEVMERLPLLQRRMIELRIEGQEVADIARLTARSKRTVERVLQDFRNNLAALLREEE